MQIILNLNVFFIMLAMQLSCYSQTGSGSPDVWPVPGNYRLNEKIILETDRDLYLAGEEINVSCFAYEPVLMRKLDLSKIAYVEFYTLNNIPIQKIKIEMHEGLGAGYFRIPGNLSSGVYYLRAYTNYMKNSGCAGFSYTSVIVMNPFREINQENPSTSAGSLLQKCTLFPEGGQVVYGTSNRITCKFSDDMGRPVPCEARVLDSNNQVIAQFATNSYGLGSFVFTPVPFTQYRVEATAGAYTVTEYIQFPGHAVTLQKVYQNDHELQFRLPRFQYTAFPLSLELNQSGNATVLSTVREEDSVVTIRLGALPKGIIGFRLCNSEKEVLASRNVYNSTGQKTEIQLLTNKKAYGNRELVELTIDGNPEEWEEGALSVSVFLVDQMEMRQYPATDWQKSLQSTLYPFLSGSPYPASEVAKDSIFLEEVLAVMEPVNSHPGISHLQDYAEMTYLPEIKKDILTGSIMDDNNHPVSAATVMQSWVDTTNSIQTTKTNKEGRFYFENEISGDHEIVLTCEQSPGGRIVLQDEFYQEYLSHAGEAFETDPGSLDILKQKMIILQINDAYFDERENSSPDSQLPICLSPDKTFLIDDYIPLPTLSEFLFEIVPGIIPIQRKDRTDIRILYPAMDVPFGDHPLFLVDGIPVFESDRVANLRCADIYSVGVTYEKCFLQDATFDGILFIRTREGNASILGIPDGTFLDRFIGTQSSAGLHNRSLEPVNPEEPFFSTQLYWDPFINLDATGKNRITFASPDNAGSYLIRCSLKKPDGSHVSFYTSIDVN